MCDFGLPPEVNGYTAGRAMEPRAKEASEDECGGCGNLKQSCHEVRFGVFLCQEMWTYCVKNRPETITGDMIQHEYLHRYLFMLRLHSLLQEVL